MHMIKLHLFIIVACGSLVPDTTILLSHALSRCASCFDKCRSYVVRVFFNFNIVQLQQLGFRKIIYIYGICSQNVSFETLKLWFLWGLLKALLQF